MPKFKRKDEMQSFVAFRRHIYQGKLFEINDKLPEDMKPGYGFMPSEIAEDAEEREKFIKKLSKKK